MKEKIRSISEACHEKARANLRLTEKNREIGLREIVKEITLYREDYDNGNITCEY